MCKTSYTRTTKQKPVMQPTQFPMTTGVQTLAPVTMTNQASQTGTQEQAGNGLIEKIKEKAKTLTTTNMVVIALTLASAIAVALSMSNKVKVKR